MIETVALPELSSPDPGDVLKQMLTENTGRQMCDSGDFYGRHWQMNQGRDFEPEPATTLSFRWDFIEVTHNIYHWLKERLTYSPEWQAKFDAFVAQKDEEIEAERAIKGRYSVDTLSWPELMHLFPAHLAKQGSDVGGIYGEDDAIGDNSYNHDNLLSQDIQFVYMEVEGEGVVLLQIHGGCDARGGYTAPKLFTLDADEFSIFDYAKATIQCSNYGQCLDPLQEILFPELGRQVVEHYWTTDDGYHWYQQGEGGRKDLREYELVDWDREGAPVPGARDTEVIVVDKDGAGYCPLCGGKLEAWSS